MFLVLNFWHFLCWKFILKVNFTKNYTMILGGGRGLISHLIGKLTVKIYLVYCVIIPEQTYRKKSCIRETPTLSTNTDSSTDTITNLWYFNFLRGGKAGLTNERPWTDHVISGPMRGLNNFFTGRGQHSDRQTLRLYDQLGQEGQFGENPAYGRHQLSRPVRIVSPIP